MSRRMWVLAVTVWAVVVVAGSAATWVAIDRAGNQVAGRPSTGPTQPVVVGTVGPAPTRTAKPTRKPSHRATPHATPSHLPTAATPPTTPRSTASSQHSSPTPRVSTAQAPDQTETRTWTGTAGSMTVSCTGSTVRLRGASPNDGWSVERGDTSGSQVEVTFKNGETEVQVQASCVGGVPRFHVESGSGGYDDH